MYQELTQVPPTETPELVAPQPIMAPPIVVSAPLIVSNLNLPFNVGTELNQYKRIFITLEYDYFKIVHNYENALMDYIVYGELPDGDKKVIFTASRHFECKCCTCCDQCVLSCCICDYVCCDEILFQMDYKRNGLPFYTQGLNIMKGCYCCKCYCCATCCNCCFDCCPNNRLFLRENIDPNNRDFNVGIKKGVTDAGDSCCCCCPDKLAIYTTEEGFAGPTVRAKFCDIQKEQCVESCCCCCCCNADFEMSIEDANGMKTGNVMIYSGNYSQKVQGNCCYHPRRYFEVNMPLNATSEQKFQIIADLIHFDLTFHAL